MIKRIFTILLIGFLIFLSEQSVNAQATWIKTQNLDNILPSTHNDSLSVGPIEMCRRPDGKIWVLMQINQNHDTWLYLVDSTGKILLSRNVAIHGTIFYEDCYNLKLTSDSGCVYIRRHVSFSNYVEDVVYRINSNGAILWTKSYLFASGINNLVSSAIPTYYNTFLILFERDSLIELSSNGNYIRSRAPIFDGIIITLPDSNFIYTYADTISKEDFVGNQQWSLYAPGYEVAYANLSYLYARSSGGVMKINTLNGSIIWVKTIASKSLSETSDDGFIVLDYNDISKYDSAGILQWSKTKQFPHYDFKKICEINPKIYITGGCWNNLDLILVHYPGYSPFLATIDSAGNGVIDSTDYFFVGNANDNNLVSFGDDAVYIAAAMGNSGSPRDSLLRNSFFKNAFATDWSSKFCTGLNHKYSDYDGNGIIDTADIRSLSWIYPKIVKPHWLRESNNSLAPILHFSLENNNLSYTDTIKINVILGSTNTAIDSIYGFSFDLRFNLLVPGSGGIQSFYSLHPTALGDTNSNLYSYYYSNQVGTPILTSMVLCRTDHINAYVAGDTVITLYYLFPSTAAFLNPVTLSINWSAITECGFPVSLNLVSDTLILFGSVGINEFNPNDIKISPNPAHDQISFSFPSHDIEELIIFDATGRKILSINNPGNIYILNVRDFDEGLYYFSTHASNKIYRSKFLVVH